jgi:hypothetical protein
MKIKELAQLLRRREFLILLLGTQAMIALVINNIDFARTFEGLACGCMTFSVRSGQLWDGIRTQDAEPHTGSDAASSTARHAFYLLKKHQVDTFQISAELAKNPLNSLFIIEMVWPRRLDSDASFMLVPASNAGLDPAWREIDRKKELALAARR